MSHPPKSPDLAPNNFFILAEQSDACEERAADVGLEKKSVSKVGSNN